MFAYRLLVGKGTEPPGGQSYNGEVSVTGRLTFGAAVFCVFATLPAAALAQTPPPTSAPPTQNPPPPVPRPFPGAPTAPTQGKPADPAGTTSGAARTAQAAPTAAELGNAPVYPGAEYLDTFDAGRGQQYVIYGTNAPFTDIVAYYRNVLKSGGRELFKTPAMHQFDLGRFEEETMAFPPSVVVKDYTWNGSAGYLVISGTTEKRYRTIIQIVAK